MNAAAAGIFFDRGVTIWSDSQCTDIRDQKAGYADSWPKRKFPSRTIASCICSRIGA